MWRKLLFSKSKFKKKNMKLQADSSRCKTLHEFFKQGWSNRGI